MVLHLVSGFLGSGKTTAISTAVRILSDLGRSAGVVTNDQGKYLVDTQFFQTIGVPNAEVTGGCFCCNYNQLNDAIERLQLEDRSTILFAESVGSCTDLVATVIRPLMVYRKDIESLTFSTFVDAPLLRSHLLGQELSLHEDTAYIWHKQLEEADILVINKIDLISSDDIQMFKLKADNKFKGKRLIYQNSLSKDSVRLWIQDLDKYERPRIAQSLAIDYSKYGAGEANLAWLDQSLEILTPDQSAWTITREVIDGIAQSIRNDGMVIAHLKFILHCDGHSHKTSITSTTYDTVPVSPGSGLTNRVLLVINARIEASPAALRSLVSKVVGQVRSRHDVQIIERNISFFRPGFPQPTHRLV